jgi:Zn2+/Cd2+-exporting ATPase
MAVQHETFEVTGIRCERCVNRLAAALRGHDGLEFATANLAGQVTLEWDDAVTSRDTLVATLDGAGFRQRASDESFS